MPFGLNLNTVMAPGGQEKRKEKRNYNQEQAKGQIVLALRGLVQRLRDYNLQAGASASDSD